MHTNKSCPMCDENTVRRVITFGEVSMLLGLSIENGLSRFGKKKLSSNLWVYTLHLL